MAANPLAGWLADAWIRPLRRGSAFRSGWAASSTAALAEALGRVGRDAAEHVRQSCLRVDVVQLRRHDQVVEERHPLPARRVRRPEDVAQAILFVAANPFVTGTTVTVDGGGTIA